MPILTEPILGWHLLLAVAALIFHLWTRRQADKKMEKLHEENMHLMKEYMQNTEFQFVNYIEELQTKFQFEKEELVQIVKQSDKRIQNNFENLQMDFWEQGRKLSEHKSRIEALEWNLKLSETSP